MNYDALNINYRLSESFNKLYNSCTFGEVLNFTTGNEIGFCFKFRTVKQYYKYPIGSALEASLRNVLIYIVDFPSPYIRKFGCCYLYTEEDPETIADKIEIFILHNS